MVRLKQFIHMLTAHLVAAILRPVSVHDTRNFELWQRHGYHITPLHFYSPVPDTREIKNKVFAPTELLGVNLRPVAQLRLMQEVFIQFSEEYNDFLVKTSAEDTFYLDNDAFTGIDPHVYYCMLRHFNPSMVIEVGSGHSTLLGAHACRLNNSTRYVNIDPWPRDFILKGVPNVEFMREKVENVNLDIFRQLQEGDILFVDSSHVVRTANDVCFLILEVLPRLASGVIVHFHDIFLPFEYPKEWIVNGQQFWAEQYLLHAFLIGNQQVEILFASHFITKTYPDEVKTMFPYALKNDGASFWFKVK